MGIRMRSQRRSQASELIIEVCQGKPKSYQNMYFPGSFAQNSQFQGFQPYQTDHFYQCPPQYLWYLWTSSNLIPYEKQQESPQKQHICAEQPSLDLESDPKFGRESTGKVPISTFPKTENENLQIIQSHRDESDYEPQGQAFMNDVKGLPTMHYTRKNTESNIVNQIFSFVCCEAKSGQLLKKIYRGEKTKIWTFYELLRRLKKSSKKYINRRYLVNLAQLKPKNAAYRMLTKPPIRPSKNRSKALSEDLSAEEFRRGFRILILYYARKQCTESVIRSRKLNKETWCEHLERRREVLKYITQYIQSDIDPVEDDY